MHARTAVIALAALALAATACGDDDDSSAKKSSTSSTTATTVAPSTTSSPPATTVPVTTSPPPTVVTLPAGRPTCDGAAGVERDVRASYNGVVPNPSTDIIVSQVRLASADPSYASAQSGPSGPSVQIQGAYSILQCPEVGGSGGNLWVVLSEGTAEVGCDLQLPPAVRQELVQGC